MDSKQIYKRALEVMTENFSQVTEMCLATSANDIVAARDLHAYYHDGKMYVLSKIGNTLMHDVQINPNVGLCHGSHNMQGVARSLGHPLDKQNAAMRKAMKREFSLNYDEYVTEDNTDMRIVEITLTHAETFTRYHRYEIDFVNKTAERDHTHPLFIYR
ncbi:MAG: hypothetical protein NC132_02365 [Corallococcus sp.]|nr:hypothetical protein [Corallococcus sp.]MCM1358953.1 hypothetical protein [Corallococcus sp.]MCM1394942.1 hypothetical protein [Corallococcus sp.]